VSSNLDMEEGLGRPLTDKDLGMLQFTTVLYYLHETNPDNGLVRDKTDPRAPVSIAAVGMALATIPVVVERGVLFRDFAAKITLKRLRYLLQCPQGPEPDASGYKGFFYHFLDIETGRRVWECELSTIDSAFLFAGALTVAAYFDGDAPNEVEIRRLADALYGRADWNWARNGGPTLTHGWRPEAGFIPHRYEGYDEGLLLYILGLGSPTHPLPLESYPLQALVSEPVKPIFPCVVMSNTIHAYISQSDKGELVIGAGTDAYTSYTQRGGLHVSSHALEAICELFPMFRRMRMLRNWGGIVDVSPDRSPIIARTPVPGLYVNCGWGTGGFKATPGSAHLFAWTIAHDRPHPINAPFTIERFREGRLIDEAAAAAVAH